MQRTYVAGGNSVTSGLVPSFYDNFGYSLELRLDFSDGTSGVQTRDITQFFADRSVGSAADGRLQTSANTFEHSAFWTGIGLSYVSYGEWGLSNFVEDGTGTRQTSNSGAKFIFGAKTVSADMPQSGTASYIDANGFLSLQADFGARTIAADLNFPASVNVTSGYYGEEIRDVVVGVNASGTASFAGSDFLIPLLGTSITPDAFGQLPNVIEPITGIFAGAFFGPHAEEAAGLTEIKKANGELLWAGVPFLLGRK